MTQFAQHNQASETLRSHENATNHRDILLQIEDITAHLSLCEVQGCEQGPAWSERLLSTVSHITTVWQHLLTDAAHSLLDEIEFSNRLLSKDEAIVHYASITDILRCSEQVRTLEESVLDGQARGTLGDHEKIEALKALADLAYHDVLSATRETSAQILTIIGDVLNSESDRFESELIFASPSPLSFVTRVEVVNEFLHNLERVKDAAIANPGVPHALRVSEESHALVRSALSDFILASESSLHRLAELLCNRYLGPDYNIELQVRGTLPTPRGSREIIIKEPVNPEDLYTTTDLEFALDALGAYPAQLKSSVFDYQPITFDKATNPYGIHAVRTRLKAADSLIDKLNDHLFRINLGNGASSDSQMSLYLKDIRGVGFIVDTEDDIRALYQDLTGLTFTDKELRSANISPSTDTSQFEIFHTKDKLSDKDVHWRGIKFVMFWDGTCTEVQIKTLDFFLKEQSNHTPESHGSYKQRRENSRQEFAEKQPLFGFYREYLKHVFLDTIPMPKPPESINLTTHS